MNQPAQSRLAPALLTIYIVVLAVIAVGPTRVDDGATPLLRLVTQVVPWLTYARIEFGANIALFVPLGLLLALIVRQRYLVLPLALLTTVTIESLQALLLERRVPSVLDIFANVTGGCIGLLLVALVEWVQRRGRASALQRSYRSIVIPPRPPLPYPPPPPPPPARS